MSWRFEIITTETDGEIVNRQNFPAVDGDFSLERTAGDEFYIKSGDITIKTRQAISIDTTGSRTNYLLAYWNEVLYDAFFIPRDFDEQDQKFGKFKTKFFAVQKTFFDNLESVAIAYETATDKYNDAVDDSAFDMLYRSTVGGATYVGTGFSLGALVEGLAVNKKSNDFGYRINSVTYPGNVGQNDDVALLHLETPQNVPIDITMSQAISDTFGADTGASDIDLSNWFGVFKAASFVFNGFISVKPMQFIASGIDYFGLDIVIRSRGGVTPQNTKQSRWLKRTMVKDKYRIDGVQITRANNGFYYYTKGNINTENVYRKTAPFDRTEIIMPTTPDTTFINLSPGNWDATNSRYDIRDLSLPSPYENRDWVGSGLSDAYFDALIDQGDGYEGNIIYDSEDVLDHILIKTGVADEYIQINKMKTNKRGTVAKIEGIQIAQ